MRPPPHRTARHRHRHREAGLRRISSATRALAAASFALVGAFTAIAAHTSAKAAAQTGASTTTPITGASPQPSATVGTLPPDTFPSQGVQPPQAAPQPVPETVPQTLPPIVSGSS